MDDSAGYSFRSLSDVQKKVLAVLPIPSAILSVLGSSIIIYMAIQSRKSKPWTPYNRLLLAMSVCDIVASITLGMAAFLYPKETSNKAWVFGNDTSCSAIGFLNQVSYSGTLYNAMLSFYFLFTARFAMRNEQVQKRIEPLMHGLSLGYPVLTAFAGLFLDVYAEPEVSIGCWVKRWPKFCGDGPDGTGEPCKSHLIAWAFGVWIAIFVLGSLIINNLIIWFFVHNQTKKRQRQSSNTLPSSQDDDDDDSSSDEDDDNDDDPHKAGQRETISIASSFRTAAVQAQKRAEKENQQLLDRRTQKMQNRRLRLVSSQALLFVGCFVISNLWAYILRFYEAQATEFVDEMELPFHNYHFLVLQATLLPLQGLFNMMVYIRPKYLKNRSEFHLESKLWAIRRSIFGSSVEPLHIDLGETNTNGDMSRVNGPGQRGMVSSLTQNSHDDSSGEGRHRKPRSRMKSGSSFTNSLDIIEEGENEGSKSMHCKAEGSSSEHGGGGTATRETNVIIAGNTENTSGSEPVLDAPSSQADDLVTNSKVAKPIPNSHVPDDHESQQNGLISAALPDESPDAMSHTMHTGWSTSMDSIQMENSYRTELAHEERKGISATLPEAGNVSQAELSHMVNTGWSSSMDSMPVDRKSTSGRTVLSNEMRSMEMDSMRLDESYRTELFNEQVLGRISERLTDDGPDSQFEMSHLVNTGWSSSIDSMPIDRSHRSDFADEMKGSMDSMPLDTSYRADSLAAKTKQRIISRTLPEDSSYNEGSDQYDTRWNIPPLPFDPSASGDIEENRINHGTTATMIKMDGSLTQRCVESKRKSIS